MPDISSLTEAEAQLGIELAEQHEEIRRLIPGRSRLVLVKPVTTGRADPEDARHSAVGMYDYDANRSVIAVVDLHAQEVVSVAEAPVQFQLSEEERRRAEELAGEDDRVQRFLAGRAMNPLTRLYFPPGPTSGHRYAISFLRPTDDERLYVVTDLSDDTVVALLEPDDLVAQ